MTGRNDTPNQKWIVAIQEHPRSNGETIGTIVQLPDPNNGELRDYALVSEPKENSSSNNEEATNNQKYIAEFQVQPGDFSSFFVGRHVVKDGSLYLINRVDPLFFYLAAQSCDNGTAGNNDQQQPKKKVSWQPYDQFLEQSQLPRQVASLITEEQIQHVCSTFDNEELYFKFNPEKALQWLQKKQELVLKTLVLQDQARREEQAKDGDNIVNPELKGGTKAISSNFNFGDDDNAPPSTTTSTTTTTSTKPQQPDMNALKIESLQIICNYLNQSWAKAFVEHVGCTMEQVVNKPKPEKSSSHNHAAVVSSAPSKPGYETRETPEKDNDKKDDSRYSGNKKAATGPSQTAGNKRLNKINTKGMKSIGSFFTKKPKR